MKNSITETVWSTIKSIVRERIRIYLSIIILSFSVITDVIAREALPGARYPGLDNLRGEWREPGTPHHVRADFDGNGLIDDARVKLHTFHPWSIQVLLAQPNGEPKYGTVWLSGHSNPSVPPQRVVLSVATPPLRFITFRNIQIEGCVPEEQSDMSPGCTTVERKETTINLPGLRFCLVGGGCTTRLWNAKNNVLEPTTSLILPVVSVAPNTFVGRRYSDNIPEVMGVLWQGSIGVWTAANQSKYTVSMAGLLSEKATSIRYLWLDKFITTNPVELEQYEIRHAVSVGPYPPSARYDVDSCKKKEQSKTIVAIIDDLPNGKMQALQAWSPDVDNEKLMPVNINDLDCRDRKW